MAIININGIYTQVCKCEIVFITRKLIHTYSDEHIHSFSQLHTHTHTRPYSNSHTNFHTHLLTTNMYAFTFLTNLLTHLFAHLFLILVHSLAPTTISNPAVTNLIKIHTISDSSPSQPISLIYQEVSTDNLTDILLVIFADNICW